MQTIFILASTFTLLGLSHAECSFKLGFIFPKDYECRIDIGRLNFQTDGNLAIYDGNGKPLWGTGTDGYDGNGRKGVTAIFQNDGDLVIYNAANKPVWASGTTGKGQVLVFQKDRNLVIYDDAHQAVWNSKTDRSE